MNRILIPAIALTSLLGACATYAPSEPEVKANLTSADGIARGTALVTQTTNGLNVKLQVTGVAPGEHAVHIHTTGVCAAPDYMSAGGHWNPAGRQHGMNNPQGMHMGDMPNMTVANDGTGSLDYLIAGGRISDGTSPLLDADGAAVVVHAKADDMMSDPAGNAGGRIACGVLAKS